jgi:predicted MFS family arabinose efflux permease
MTHHVHQPVAWSGVILQHLGFHVTFVAFAVLALLAAIILSIPGPQRRRWNLRNLRLRFVKKLGSEED